MKLNEYLQLCKEKGFTPINEVDGDVLFNQLVIEGLISDPEVLDVDQKYHDLYFDIWFLGYDPLWLLKYTRKGPIKIEDMHVTPEKATAMYENFNKAYRNFPNDYEPIAWLGDH